jgi:hypothetical protein
MRVKLRLLSEKDYFFCNCDLPLAPFKGLFLNFKDYELVVEKIECSMELSQLRGSIGCHRFHELVSMAVVVEVFPRTYGAGFKYLDLEKKLLKDGWKKEE